MKKHARIGRGSLVRFKNRCQESPYPMRVDVTQESADGMLMCRIGGLWWAESALITEAEWQAKQQEPNP